MARTVVSAVAYKDSFVVFCDDGTSWSPREKKWVEAYEPIPESAADAKRREPPHAPSVGVDG